MLGERSAAPPRSAERDRKGVHRASVAGPRPFFDKDADSGRQAGRLLLLSYHFPPSRAVGALRWQKLCAYAADRGYAVDVVTLDPSFVREQDAEQLDELPGGVRIFGVGMPRSRVQSFVTMALALRRSLMRRWRHRERDDEPAVVRPRHSANTPPRPDSFAWSELRAIPLSARELGRLYSSWLDYATMRAWARVVARLATELAAINEYRAVITCGPPHMVHHAGRLVAEQTGLPLILDFRDPWSLVQRVPEVFAHPLWRYLASRYERSALAAASLVVVNTDPHRAALQRVYPELAAPILTVTNGYDDEPLPAQRAARRFLVAYAGTIYLDRDPRPLFRAAARVIRELRLNPSDFGLAFMGSAGSLGGVNVREMAAEEGVANYVELRPNGPRRDALEFLANATMLVSLPQDSDMAIPSKIFEYMRYNAWLLAFAAPESATSLLLAGTSADVVRHEDVDALARVLRRRYEQHLRGEVPPRIADDRRFSRERQAEILFGALEHRVKPWTRATATEARSDAAQV